MQLPRAGAGVNGHRYDRLDLRALEVLALLRGLDADA